MLGLACAVEDGAESAHKGISVFSFQVIWAVSADSWLRAVSGREHGPAVLSQECQQSHGGAPRTVTWRGPPNL